MWWGRVLQNGADVISVGNGSFAFPTDLTTGTTYSVSVTTPLSDCTLTNGSGTIAGADTVVTIACHPPLAYYYPFDGNATDKSGNGHDGMVNGATLVADRNGNPPTAPIRSTARPGSRRSATPCRSGAQIAR